MKKKIALLLLAALVSVGLTVSCGGDDEPAKKPGTGDGTDTTTPTGQIYSITFDANGGTFADGTTAAKVVKTGTNGRVTFPDDPTNGYDDAFFGKISDEFVDWVDAQGAAVLSTKVFTADATLKAKWDRWTEPAYGDKTLALGYYNWINAPTQKGWRANGNDGVETDIEWEDITFARYLVLQTKNTTAVADFGEMQVVVSGSLVGGWTTGAGSSNTTYDRGTDTVWLVFELRTFKDNYLKFVRGAAGKFLIAYYTPDLTGLNLQEVYLTNKDLTSFKTSTTDATLAKIIQKNTEDTQIGFVTKADLGFAAAIASPKTVSFDPNGGTPASIPSIQVSSGKGMQLLYPDASRAGYDFLGWFDGSGGTLTLTD